MAAFFMCNFFRQKNVFFLNTTNNHRCRHDMLHHHGIGFYVVNDCVALELYTIFMVRCKGIKKIG